MKIGKNFDDQKANDIFDRLKNVEGKVKTKKDDSKIKNISNMMNEAKYLEDKGKFDEAVDMYKQIIFELPDASKAYAAIADIYKKQGNSDGEIDILKKAVIHCSKNDEFKKRLDGIKY